MPNHITETLSEHNLEALVALMADNLKFVAKLADAIAERLDEKYGWGQGEIKADLETLQQGQKDLSENLGGKIDTLAHNFKMYGKRLDAFEGRTNRSFEAINRRLDGSDQRPDVHSLERLGITLTRSEHEI